MADGIICYAIFGLNIFYYGPDELAQKRYVPQISFLKYYYDHYKIFGHIGYPAFEMWWNDLKDEHSGIDYGSYTPDSLMGYINRQYNVLVSMSGGSYFDGIKHGMKYGDSGQSILFEIDDFQAVQIAFETIAIYDSVALYIVDSYEKINPLREALSAFKSDLDSIKEIMKHTKYLIRPEYDNCIYEIFCKETDDIDCSNDVLTACNWANNCIAGTNWYAKNKASLIWDDKNEFCYRLKKD